MWTITEMKERGKAAFKANYWPSVLCAFLLMLLSQGTPMLYAGDEFGNSQNGNNNAWCQDNPVGWLDWKEFKKNQPLLQFVKEAIAFRKAHPILHCGKELRGTDYLGKGFPDFSVHGERAWYVNFDNTCRKSSSIEASFCGKRHHLTRCGTPIVALAKCLAPALSMKSRLRSQTVSPL